ncbi:MAG: hypothetical protein GY838_05625 [bacterium]|nr:hypothetical protein [bacterium]
MNRCILTICCALVLGGALLPAGQVRADDRVVTITETDPDGGKHQVGPGTENTIVDINSVLAFTIDRDALKTAVGRVDGIASQKLAEQISTVTKLQAAVAEGFKLLPTAGDALVAYSLDRSDASRRRMAIAVAPLGRVLRQFADAFPADTGARARINDTIIRTAAGGTMLDKYRAILEQTAREVEQMNRDLDDLARREGLYIQFGGWVATGEGTIPVHLTGFDNHPNAEPYEVTRFDFSIDDDERQELENYSTAAADLRQKEAGLLSQVGDTVKKSLDVTPTWESCLKRLETALDGLATAAEATKVRDEVADMRTAIASLAAYAKAEHDADSGVAMLTSFGQQFGELGSQAAGLLKVLEEFRDGLPAAAAADRAKIQTALNDCAGEFKDLLADESTGLGRLAALLDASRSINHEALVFGSEVLKHDLGSVPGSTRLALKNTGVRADGDALSFRLAVGKAGGSSAELESFDLHMFKVAPFIVTSPVLVYAQPRHTNVYQAAPGVSMVVSRGSRKSAFRNRFGRIGFGINISALDFDNDDNIELGFAGVATVAADMVQVGVGQNFAQNRSYWFVGVRLPLPEGGI